MESPVGFGLRIVKQQGGVKWRGGRFFLGEALGRETVGFEDVEDGRRVRIGPPQLAYLNARQMT